MFIFFSLFEYYSLLLWMLREQKRKVWGTNSLSNYSRLVWFDGFDDKNVGNISFATIPNVTFIVF